MELNVLREKHVNTKSLHQPLMDVLIFSGQHGLTLATHCNNLFKKQLAFINGLFHQFLDFDPQKCILFSMQRLLYIVRAQLYLFYNRGYCRGEQVWELLFFALNSA